MQEIIVGLEVSEFWLKEQQGKGVDPFAEMNMVLQEQFSDLEINRVRRNRLEITLRDQMKSSEVRNAIKAFLFDKYQMSIQNGDYRLNVKVSTCDVLQEPIEKKASVKDIEKSVGHSSKEEDVRLCAPQLKHFITEFDMLIKNAKKHGQEDVCWNTSLLISVDEGYGVSSTIDEIADVLEKNGFCFSSKTTKRVIEFKVPPMDSHFIKNWDKIVSEIEGTFQSEKNAGKRNYNSPLIYCFDISEVMGSINKKELFEKLSYLTRIKGSFMYVFRIPYVEEIAYNQVFAVLEDLYMLRSIVIPPYTNAELVEYLKGTLQKKNVRLEGNMDEMFEKLIVYEKKDGRFWGFRTINRLVSDIMYHKLLSAEDNQPLVLTENDLKNSYDYLTQKDSDPMLELEQLYGMSEVKRTIEEIIAQIQMYNELKKEGKKLDAPCMHMRFVGNPGTGKTTVARLVAKIFRNKGILSKGYFYEIKARDLCGQYVGETAPKTSHYCNDALGSVLFIDEAYTLYRGDSRADYGREALDTLITEMENNRDNLVVIMAGYSKEMDELLEANPGLESRMPYIIEFKSYTREELVDIFYKMLNENFSYTDGFDLAVKDFFHSISDAALESENFSNARMVRNLYERIWSKAAYRKSMSLNGEVALTEEDVQRAISDEAFQQLLTRKNNKIGF